MHTNTTAMHSLYLGLIFDGCPHTLQRYDTSWTVYWPQNPWPQMPHQVLERCNTCSDTQFYVMYTEVCLRDTYDTYVHERGLKWDGCPSVKQFNSTEQNAFTYIIVFSFCKSLVDIFVRMCAYICFLPCSKSGYMYMCSSNPPCIDVLFLGTCVET